MYQPHDIVIYGDSTLPHYTILRGNMNAILFITSFILLFCCISLFIENRLHQCYKINDAIIMEGRMYYVFLDGFERELHDKKLVIGYIIRLLTKPSIPLSRPFHKLFQNLDLAYIVLGLSISINMLYASPRLERDDFYYISLASFIVTQLIICLPIIINFWSKQKNILLLLKYTKTHTLSVKQKQTLSKMFVKATEDTPYVMLDRVILFLFHCKDKSLIQDIFPLLRHLESSLKLALILWLKKHDLSPFDAISTNLGKQYSRELLNISTMDNIAIYKQCTSEGRKNMSLGDFFVGAHLPPAYRKLFTAT